ncbi:hypothetical protein J3E69DRAFT_361253 [Trichoderma sp. SZMC 28015]
MDVDFVNDDVVYRPYAGKPSRFRWSHVLVPGELKSNPMADAPPAAWIDLATTFDGKRFIKIKRNSRPERLVIADSLHDLVVLLEEQPLVRMVHLEDDPQTAFAFKNSWQRPERDNEGEILREDTQ